MAQGNEAKAKGQGSKGGKKKGKKTEEPFQAYKRETPPRMRAKYDAEVKQQLMTQFGYKSIMEVPRIVKVSINMGLGAANQNPKVIESAVDELRAIAGQAPVVTLAKRDIATFKLRRGQKIGCMVTLRDVRMWEFLDRLISIALPQTRDFKGVSGKAFDGRGNYSLGIREQIVFPEIQYDEIDSIKGLNVTIVTTAKTDAEAYALLKYMGMPFRKMGAPKGALVAAGAQA